MRAGAVVVVPMRMSAPSSSGCAASVEALRVHDLRHTAGTLATAAGGSLREVLHRLGHAATVADSPTSVTRAGHRPTRRCCIAAIEPPHAGLMAGPRRSLDMPDW
jgi:hypothetical protein